MHHNGPSSLYLAHGAGPTIMLIRGIEGEVFLACIDAEWQHDSIAPFGGINARLFTVCPMLSLYNLGIYTSHNAYSSIIAISLIELLLYSMLTG